MASTYGIFVKIQLLHRGKLVSDPMLRYAEGEIFGHVLTADIDQLHILQFHKWANDLGYLKVDKFACRVNRGGLYYFLNTDKDVLDFCRYLRNGDFIEVCICHVVDEPHVIDDIFMEEMLGVFNGGPTGGPLNHTSGSNQMPHGHNARATNSPNPDALNTPYNSNVKGKEKAAVVEESEESSEGENEENSEGEENIEGEENSVSGENSEGEENSVSGENSEGEENSVSGENSEGASVGQGEYADFNSYHLATESDDDDYEGGSEEDDTNDSLYDIDEDFVEEGSDVDNELLSARKSKLNDKKRKLKVDAVNVNEIPTGPVGIDPGFEDIYKDKRGKYAGKLGDDEVYFDSSDPGSEESEDEVIGEDGERNVGTRKASSKIYYDPGYKKKCFQLEMIFENAKQFRSALHEYAVQRRVQIRLRPNEKHRVRATCLTGCCRWHILGSIDGKSGNFMVKSYYPVHKCLKVTRNKSANTSWIVKNYKDRIIQQPQITLKELQLLIQKKYSVYVGKTICARAKYKVLAEHMGNYMEEFARIYDYADMIRATNPGSTVVVKTSKETQPGKEVFMGIYICLHALKTGWLEGCRNAIGVDGAFLKGICQGELLSAIAKDGNNQMYPVAWAVVDKETKHTWSWFFRCLKEDLNLTETEGEGLMIVSDMQKGLVEAVKDIIPNAEHRWCARHIWSNWKKTFAGEERRIKFWVVARSSFEVELKDKIDELAELGDGIIEALLTYPKQSWCRAYFKDFSKCDVVENNMCETFNSWILTARYKSIITMLEEIRHKIMERFGKMREFCSKWPSDVSLMAQSWVEDMTEKASDCELVWNGDKGFEIIDGDYRHTVNMLNRECSCRSWQLKGLLCAHAVCAMLNRRLDPMDYVDHWYRRETYLKAYSTFIQPITNLKMWPPSAHPTVEPPVITRMPGRPKKNKRKEADEPKKKFGKRSRKGTPMTCSQCKTRGHNKKGCPTLKGQGNAADNGAGPSHNPIQGAGSSNNPSYRGGPNHNQGNGTAAGLGAGTTNCQGNAAAHRAGSSNNQANQSGTRTQPVTSRTIQNWLNISGRFKRPASGGTSSTSGQSIAAASANATRGCPRAAGFGVLFASSGAVIQRSGNRVNVLHNPGNYKDATQINVDLGYKPHGLRYQGRKAITQRQLREQAAKRRQAKGPTAPSSSQPSLNMSQPSQSQSQNF